MVGTRKHPGNRDPIIGKERTEGFIEALAKNNIPVNKEWILEGGFDLKDGYESFNKLYRSRKMGIEAIKLLISEIETKGKRGISEICIEEELLWRKSVKRKMKT